jgi:crotonyl-CoA carboxylase/reductase
MYAWTIRANRHGLPETAFEVEIVPVWDIGSDEVLVYVMAAGLNFNGVWAAEGVPSSVLQIHKHDFHVAGSDASGIVWAVGSAVTRWKVGDEVVIHCNQVDGDDEECNGGDPMLSTSQRIWGFETPDGSFSQFTRVHKSQLLPKPGQLSWPESACYMLTLATAYRMLFGHDSVRIQPGQSVLIWGAGGGLGAFAIQLCRLVEA